MESNKKQYVHRNIPKQKTSEKTKNGVRQKRDFIQLCTIKYVQSDHGEWGRGGGSNSDMHRGRVVFKGYDHKS